MIFDMSRTNPKSDTFNTMNTYYSDEYAERMCNLYLSDELVLDDKNSACLTRYRLHARQPHTIDMALRYTIKCPHCNSYLKQIGRCRNSHELGLYACPACDHRKTNGGR